MLMSVLARNWWAFVIRGVLAVLLGLIALLLPGVTMLSLVLLFAAYACADGIFAIVGAVRAARAHERWDILVLEGVVDILAALAALSWPGLTVLVFVTLLALWALMSGGLLLAAAFKVEHDHGRWWMMLAAVASIVYGGALLMAPLLGALVLTWWLGAYALVFGIAMLVLAFHLRARLRGVALT
jgi:uncharacterized membrane protein HdeD (DUF308 family)